MHVPIVHGVSHKPATFNDMQKPAHKEGSKLRRQLMRELSTTTTKPKLWPHRSAGLRAQASCWENTSITLHAVTVATGGLLALRWKVITKTVFEYHGFHRRWHGCPRCFSNVRDEITNYNQTRERALRATVYRVIKKWDQNRNGQIKNTERSAKTGNENLRARSESAKLNK